MFAFITSDVGSSHTVMEQQGSLGSGRVSHFSESFAITLEGGHLQEILILSGDYFLHNQEI